MSAAVTGAAATTPSRARCPYLGLIPYSETDARFFFGRDEDTRLIVASLYSARVTTVFGPSGVGKSSVLRAGVMRELRSRVQRSVLRGAKPSLLVVYFNRWQGDVRADLWNAIARELEGVAGRDAARQMQGGSLADVLEAISRDHKLDVMLLLDQFEEYFRYETRFAEPGSFALEFAEAVQRKWLPVSFLLSLREDSLAELDRFKLLVGNLLSNWYRLDRLSVEAAREAILGPVGRYNELPDSEREFGGQVAVEPALADEVIRQVEMGRVTVGEAGKAHARAGATGVETPYLQLVMVKLWETEMASGSRLLRLATLERLNGAKEIVRSHVDAVMRGLGAAEQRLAEDAFDYLVTDSGAKIAWRAHDLAGKVRRTPEEVRAWLEKLSSGSARILTPVAPSPDHPDEPQFEIFHDTLSKAVLSWRRRRVEARRQWKWSLWVFGICGLCVVAGVVFGLYQKQVAKLRADSAEALRESAAASQRALQAEMQQRLLAEALAAERSGNERRAAELRQDAERLRQEIAKAEKAPPAKLDYGRETTDSVWQKTVDMERQRANQAEALAARLDEELRLMRLRSPPSVEQNTAPSPEPADTWLTFACALQRIIVHDDGTAGSTPWEFIIRIQNEGAPPITARVNAELNDDRPTRVVTLNRVWETRAARTAQGVRVDIEGVTPKRPEVKAAGWGMVLRQAGARDRIRVIAPKASDGNFEFEFALKPRPALSTLR